jgi:hypothetical protein
MNYAVLQRSKSIILRILGLVVVLPMLASGCAPSNKYMDKTERILKPEQGMAMVTFVRPHSVSGVGSAMHFGVWDSENFVGFLTYGKYIQYQTAPGEHYFLVKAENWACVKANLAPDKQYVIKATAFGGYTKFAAVALNPVMDVDYKSGQIKDVKEWLTKLEPTKPKMQKLERYIRSQQSGVSDTLTKVKSGGGKLEILEPRDFLPE